VMGCTGHGERSVRMLITFEEGLSDPNIVLSNMSGIPQECCMKGAFCTGSFEGGNIGSGLSGWLRSTN